jgi:hypothetical protein
LAGIVTNPTIVNKLNTKNNLMVKKALINTGANEAKYVKLKVALFIA